jgi:hypothetical protein
MAHFLGLKSKMCMTDEPRCFTALGPKRFQWPPSRSLDKLDTLKVEAINYR